MRKVLIVIGCLGLVGCIKNVKRSEFPNDYASKNDIEVIRRELVAQIEAGVELMKEDSQRTRSVVKKVVGECLCPTDMK